MHQLSDTGRLSLSHSVSRKHEPLFNLFEFAFITDALLQPSSLN